MPLAESLKQILSQVPIFSGLAPSEMEFLAQRVVPRNYSAGQMVFNEGDPCSGLYVVAAGHVRIFKTSAGGREQVLSIDGTGSSVAELPVFDGGTIPHRLLRSMIERFYCLSASRIFRNSALPILKSR